MSHVRLFLQKVAHLNNKQKGKRHCKPVMSFNSVNHYNKCKVSDFIQKKKRNKMMLATTKYNILKLQLGGSCMYVRKI